MMSTNAATPAAATGPGGDAVEALQLGRQNAYLKQRCAQLQEDVTNLNAQVIRLQQELERLRGQRATLAGSRP
jgi:outer membrane murein-binding lipoprotein Lpp